MVRFIIKRVLGAVVVVWIVSVITFLIFQLAPALSKTNPVYYYVGKIPFPEHSVQMQMLEHRFGFDLPLIQQYWHWLRSILFGQTITDGLSTPIHCPAPCFGYSFRQSELVGHLISQAIPVTVSLATGAAILWLIVGISIGTLSAIKPGSFIDRAGMGVSLAAISMPIFFTGPLVLLIFSYTLGWLPNTQYAPITQDPLQWLASMILPWVCLAFLYSAMYARLTRNNMLEVMGEDYIRTARAKGLPQQTVIVKHGLRSALTPIVTIFGMDLGQLVGTTVITENVFNLRGLGYLSIQAIGNMDLPVIMGVTVVAAVALVICNLIVDILYAFIDPRVSY